MYYKTLKSKILMKLPQLRNSKITNTAISNKKGDKKVSLQYLSEIYFTEN
jgi:hypothetical protein